MKLCQYLKKHHGEAARLAKELGVTPAAISKWKQSNHVPANRVIGLWLATNKEVKPYHVRPDIYTPEIIAQISTLEPL